MPRVCWPSILGSNLYSDLQFNNKLFFNEYLMVRAMSGSEVTQWTTCDFAKKLQILPILTKSEVVH